MTNSEVLTLVKSRCENCEDSHLCDICDVPVIIKALEKQIPTKPELNHHCPNCSRALPIPGLVDEWCKECFYPSFCPHCGQSLLWEDDNDQAR